MHLAAPVVEGQGVHFSEHISSRLTGIVAQKMPKMKKWIFEINLLAC